ncbi:MAG: PQQ-like beta-propeller repeat protein [Kiritimatiellae bacterium]|nr:PQQ-like beta-propeller repeat protein [Kiritimatiellia bacterium]
MNWTFRIVMMVVFVAGCAVDDQPVARTADVADEISVGKLSGQTQWPTFHGDSTLSGFVEEQLPEKMARLWRVKVPGEVSTTPVVFEEKICCVAGMRTVIALDMNGRQVWRRELGGGADKAAISAPLLAVCGLVVCAMDDGRVFALDAGTGEERWKYRVAGNLMGAPNYIINEVGKGCLVTVIDQQDGVVHAINVETGKNVWTAEKTVRCDGSVAVGGGKVVFGSCASAIHVLSSETGEWLGNVELGEGSEMAGSLAIVDGRVYSGNRSGALVCVDTVKLEETWTNTDGEGEFFIAPAVTKEMVVFFSNDGNVYGLSRDDGKQRWVYDAGAAESRSPIVVGDAVVVVVDGAINILSLANGEKIWSYHVGDEVTSAAYAYGRLIVGTGAGEIIAFGGVAEKDLISQRRKTCPPQAWLLEMGEEGIDE